MYFLPSYIYKKLLIKKLNKLLDYKNFLKKKKLYSQISKNTNLHINKNLGYKFLEDELVLPGELLKNINHHLKGVNIHNKINLKEGKKFSVNLLDEDNVQKIKGLLEFILNSKILFIAADYLQTIPFLANVSIYCSFPSKEIVSSKMFHCDTEDTNQLKFFFYLQDVTLNDGPFCFLDKKVSEKVFKKTKYQGKRLKDEEVYKFVSNQSNNIFLGKKGQGLAIDTSRCLHYGSRDISNTRLVLLVQFCDPYASLYYKSELNKYINMKNFSDLQKSICSPSKKKFGH